MLKNKDAFVINSYGQGITDINFIIGSFEVLNLEMKIDYLEEVLSLILQSRPIDSDIEPTIEQSKLKATYVPCVLLRKGVTSHQLKKLISLPEKELTKSLVLLLNLFKIAYTRRFIEEKNNQNKWWYADFSDPTVLRRIENELGIG